MRWEELKVGTVLHYYEKQEDNTPPMSYLVLGCSSCLNDVVMVNVDVLCLQTGTRFTDFKQKGICLISRNIRIELAAEGK